MSESMARAVTFGTVVALTAASTIAQPGPSRESQNDANPADKESAGDERKARNHQFVHAALLKNLKLNDQQRQRVDQIWDQHRQRVRDWQAQRHEQIEKIRRQMRDARAQNQAERVEALQQKLRNLFEARPTLDDLGEELKATLTDAQWQQFEQNRADLRQQIVQRTRQRDRTSPRFERVQQSLDKLEMTDEQRQQVRQITDKHRQHARQRRELTDEQRQVLRELRQEINEAREAGERDKVSALRQRRRELMQDARPDQPLHAELRKVLPPTQWRQFRREMRQHRTSSDRPHNRPQGSDSNHAPD